MFDKEDKLIRPNVALPMAREFNKKLPIDLKITSGGKTLLRMVDMWSRLTI